jgi:hypothetical protein
MDKCDCPYLMLIVMALLFWGTFFSLLLTAGH